MIGMNLRCGGSTLQSLPSYRKNFKKTLFLSQILLVVMLFILSKSCMFL